MQKFCEEEVIPECIFVLHVRGFQDYFWLKTEKKN